MRSLFWLAFSLILVSAVSASEKKKLYKWTDENGNVHYSDEPHAGAEEVEMKQVPAIKMVPPKVKPIELDDLEDSRQSNSDDQRAPGKPYSKLALIEPEADGVVRNNASTVSLKAAVEPGLLDGHRIRFYLDGKAVSNSNTEMSVEVSDVEYGPHSAKFTVVDEKGKEVQSSKSVSFQLLHVINRNLRNNR